MTRTRFPSALRRACTALAWLCAPAMMGAAPAVSDDASRAFGGLHPGMSIAAARTARDDVTWRPVDRRIGVVESAVAHAAYRHDGRDYDVLLETGYDGAYRLALEHLARGIDANGCKAALDGLATDVETRFGELDVPPHARETRAPGSAMVQRTAEGHPFVVVQAGELVHEAAPTVDVGRSSHAAHFATEGDIDGAAGWSAYRGPTRAQPLEVVVHAQYARVDGTPGCMLRATLARAGASPEHRELDLGATPPLGAASIGLRHHTLDAPGATPDRPVTIAVRCSVERHNGTVWRCAPERPGVGRARRLDEAAVTRALAYRFDPNAIDRFDPVPLSVRLPITLAASDRVQLPPPPTTLRTLREFRWEERATGADLERAYPRAALGKEREAEVSTACQVQSDRSLVCVDAVVAPNEDAREAGAFALAAYTVLTRFRAAPLLVDGTTPSVGQWVNARVAFRMAD